jgi:hypothetical protein
MTTTTPTDTRRDEGEKDCCCLSCERGKPYCLKVVAELGLWDVMNAIYNGVSK